MTKFLALFRRLTCLLLAMTALGLSLYAQQTVKGRIVDEKGMPIPGVGVLVKGTSQGTVSDIDGTYNLPVQKGQTLVFNFLGYIDQNILVGDSSTIDVIMTEDAKALDEVVVVGYGTMKKKDLLGAVDQVDDKVINNRSNGNLARSLQGEIAGLNISFTDGKPSRNASYNVRGATSIGAGGSSLVLIDGVEGDLNTVNPQDVASVTVLKDASSTAVYGARGAFGVILVTTKNAEKGRPVVNYSGSVTFNRRTVIYDNISDSAEYVNWWRTAYNGYYSAAVPSHIDSKVPYSEAIYQELLRRNQEPSLSKVVESTDVSGFGYNYYANTDWYNAFYKDYHMSQEHNLSVSGGNDNADYYVSARYYGSDGIYKIGEEYYRKYDMRAKGSLKIRPWLRLSDNISLSVTDNKQPRIQDGNSVQRQLAFTAIPLSTITNPDGNWTYCAATTGYAAFSEGNNYQTDNRVYVRNKASLDIDLVKDQLVFQADYSFNYTQRKNIVVQNMVTYSKSPDVILYEKQSTGDKLQQVTYDTRYQSANAYLTYTPKLPKAHKVNVLLGWNVEWQKYTTQTDTRTGFTSSKPSFSLMDGEATISSGGNAWSYMGAFFRVNYNLLSRYLFEVSGRYDGSSKFPQNSQWGFFPSGSFAWRLADERWMDWAKPALDNLKIRLSAGSMGNGNVAPYSYNSEMAVKTATDIVIGGQLPSYSTVASVVPVSLTWERATTYDAGIDLDMLNSRLSLCADYYVRMTEDMYTASVTLPAVYGASSPKGNNASMRTNGWELSLQWRDQVQAGAHPFGYSIKASLWDSRSFITKYAGNDTKRLANSLDALISNNGNPANYYEGMEVGEIWGYTVQGIFKNQAEIDAAPTQSFLQNSSKTTTPGQVRFADLDDDNDINYGELTVDKPGDLSKIGSSVAHYNFGLNFSFNWNGIGLNAFFQGCFKKDWYPGLNNSYFWGIYNRPYITFIPSTMKLDGGAVAQMSSDGSECVNAETAYWPRPTTYQAHEASASRPLGLANTRYLQNAAYVRLKNLQLDYSFPQKICNAVCMQGLKVYFNAENLFCWSPMQKYASNFDPEGLSYDTDASNSNSSFNGNTYPLFKTFTLGLNITF